MTEITTLEAMAQRWEAEDLPLLTGFPRDSLKIAIADLHMEIVDMRDEMEGEDG